MTLKRYVRKLKEQATRNISFVPNYKQSQIFTDAEEIELENYALKTSRMNHGLTPNLMRKLVFKFANVNNEKRY